MEALQGAARPLTYDERAIVMASAITIDIDYFSRHSGNGGFLPIPMIGGGGGGGVPAPVPNPVGGGVGGMPMPIILPGGGVGDGDGGVTDVSSSSSGTTPSSAYPSQQIVNNNNGGFVPDEASQHEDGFLPDEQDSNGGWLSGFFEDD